MPNKKTFIILIAALLSSCSSQKQLLHNAAPFPSFDMEGHRGGRGIMPENTIPAMLYAVDIGMTTLEMDTHITADGKVILSHDDYMNPLITTKPDGTELTESERKNYAFMQMPYTEIKKYDVGLKHFAQYPKQHKMKVSIPSLADVIDSVQHHLKLTGKKQVFYNIETKSSKAGDGTLNPTPEVFVKTLMDVIESKKITPYVIIQSADERTLQVLHKKYPYVRTSYLLGAASKKRNLDENLSILGFIPYIYSPTFKIVNAGLVKACHDKGMKVVVWTPDTQKDVNRMKDLGVDGIITNYPELLLH